MWLDLGPPPRPTGRFRYTTYRLPTDTLTVYSISTKAHTSWLRNSFSCHAVADICCLRQQDVIFHYFHNLPLSQKLDPRLNSNCRVLDEEEKRLIVQGYGNVTSMQFTGSYYRCYTVLRVPAILRQCFVDTFGNNLFYTLTLCFADLCTV